MQEELDKLLQVAEQYREAAIKIEKAVASIRCLVPLPNNTGSGTSLNYHTRDGSINNLVINTLRQIGTSSAGELYEHLTTILNISVTKPTIASAVTKLQKAGVLIKVSKSPVRVQVAEEKLNCSHTEQESTIPKSDMHETIPNYESSVDY